MLFLEKNVDNSGFIVGFLICLHDASQDIRLGQIDVSNIYKSILSKALKEFKIDVLTQRTWSSSSYNEYLYSAPVWLLMVWYQYHSVWIAGYSRRNAWGPGRRLNRLGDHDEIVRAMRHDRDWHIRSPRGSQEARFGAPRRIGGIYVFPFFSTFHLQSVLTSKVPSQPSGNFHRAELHRATARNIYKTLCKNATQRTHWLGKDAHNKLRTAKIVACCEDMLRINTINSGTFAW